MKEETNNIRQQIEHFEQMQNYLDTPEAQEKYIEAIKAYIVKNFVHVKDLNIGDKQIFMVRDKPIKIIEENTN